MIQLLLATQQQHARYFNSVFYYFLIGMTFGALSATLVWTESGFNAPGIRSTLSRLNTAYPTKLHYTENEPNIPAQAPTL